MGVKVEGREGEEGHREGVFGDAGDEYIFLLGDSVLKGSGR